MPSEVVIAEQELVMKTISNWGLLAAYHIG
jgi:hypothetical protein